MPGVCSLTGARVLAENGDDRTRFANAGSLKAYAGSAPVTRASGKSCVVMSRRVKNQRLAAVGHVWARSAACGPRLPHEVSCSSAARYSLWLCTP
ncbi:transposase [Streptomyces lavendulae]|uniref:transposase n=1 Tax=Streptomyces lavendulae TaxID=1914 RepID=UPI0033235DE5